MAVFQTAGAWSMRNRGRRIGLGGLGRWAGWRVGACKGVGGGFDTYVTPFHLFPPPPQERLSSTSSTTTTTTT
ncbi:predicted protein [Plenodomus lingam JN3]|uniref:Uncharacterized protein n=1 Tax=Leptosphaeria maculans (strain JN3 / isolate v23.1.3 / race Av1-4-5-6-7-8) TaxID=985895 RepID=E4ZFU7_LEPMJ|nr:predicted protein [Plenodomus lingam JN3]CBX90167.1 predicted protein [Plenodomus lingam JN3]